jgi:serine protease Do
MKMCAVAKPGISTALLLAALASSSFAATTVHKTSPSEQRNAARSPSQSYLGIDVRDIGDDQVTTLKLKDTRGAEIIRVDHDGPAGKMGLREHDVVLQMNGIAIQGEEQLRRMLHDCPPGKLVVLAIGRDGQTLTVSAPMADRIEIERQVWEQHLGAAAGLPGPQAPPIAMPANDPAAAVDAPSGPVPTPRYSKSFLGTLLTSPTYTGAMLEIVGPQLAQYFGVAGGSGLLVRSVADNSPASMAGLRAGDVVVRANARPMLSVNQWTKMIREAKGKPVSVVVLRDRQEKILTLTPDLKHKSSLALPLKILDRVQVASL